MKNLIFFVVGAVAGFFFFKTCTPAQPEIQATDNIDRIDSLTVLVQDGERQLVENEKIIQEMQTLIDGLRKKEREGNRTAGKLAAIIENQKKELEAERAKIQRLTVLLANTKAEFETQLEEIGVGDEVGVDLPEYTTYYKDSANWFELSGKINPNTRKATFSMTARNEFIISDFSAQDGKARFRVESRNPYTYVMPGTNSFEFPIGIEKPKQRRFGLGITAGVIAGQDLINKRIVAGYGLSTGLTYRIF